MPPPYQTPCYIPLVLRHTLIAMLLATACSRGGTDSAPKPVERPERTDVIRRGDGPLTLLGPTLDVGDAMPDATLAVFEGEKVAALQLGTLKGKVTVLSVVPSIDTRVCETQTHKVSDAIAQMPPGTEVYTVSRDLPFAQRRFAEEARTQTKMASDFKERDFGRLFGVDVKETGLLARSVWVVGKDGKIAYRELVANQGTEPDYDALLAAVKQAAGG
jgi:thiol peroxidase